MSDASPVELPQPPSLDLSVPSLSGSSGSLSLYSAIAWRTQPHRTLNGAYKRALFVVRSYLGRPHTDAWYRWLRSPLMAAIAEANPCLYKKIVRPYLTPNCTRFQQIAMIRAHYEFLARHMSHADIVAVSSMPGLPLLKIAGKDGEPYRVVLQSESKFNKEGEITLALYSQQHNVRVYSLTFLVASHDGTCPVMIIGATQGLDRGVSKDIIKDVARSLHGLRPKALLFHMAQVLAQSWNLRAIRAVSNTLHISNHRDYRFNRSRQAFLNYDEFWTECQGTLRTDGFFALPLQHAARPLEEIKLNKRSLYRQRYAMMAILASELKAVVAGLKARRDPPHEHSRLHAARHRPLIASA